MHATIRQLHGIVEPQQMTLFWQLPVNVQRYFKIDVELEHFEGRLATAQTRLANTLAQQDIGLILRTCINITGYRNRLAQLRAEQLPRQSDVDANQDAPAFIVNRAVLIPLGQMQSIKENIVR